MKKVHRKYLPHLPPLYEDENAKGLIDFLVISAETAIKQFKDNVAELVQVNTLNMIIIILNEQSLINPHFTKFKTT